MNSNSPLDREALFRLFGAVSQGTTTDEESAALGESLATSASARKLWFLYQDMELGLEEWAASRNHESEEILTQALSQPVSRAPIASVSKPLPRRAPIRLFPRFAAAAAIIAGLGIALWSITGKPRSGEGLATLTRSSSARWENTRLEPGTPILSPQKLDLTSGMVELSMSSGALVVFEGPGRMELLSNNAVRIHSGRIHATVPPSAKGFTLESNGFTVIDHGTEFGCAAPKSGTAEVHVFKGSVELKPWNREARWLQGNQAIAIKAGTLEPITARPELFISSSDLNHRESDASSFRKQASRMLQNHPAALVHFDASGVQGSTLANAAATADLPPASIQGCTLVEGREPGRNALYFDGKSSQISLKAPRKTRALTLLAWIRTTEKSRRQDLISGSGPMLPGEIAWYLYYGNAMGFGAHVPVSNLSARGWRNLHSAPINTPLTEWSLVATVIDAKTKTITHFLNGKIVGMGQVALPPILRLGPLTIGATAPNRDPETQTHRFHGAIDEFAIIAAPLSAEEISRLYEFGRPGFQNPTF